MPEPRLWVARDDDDRFGAAWVWLIAGEPVIRDGKWRGDDCVRIDADLFPDLPVGECRPVRLVMEDV